MYSLFITTEAPEPKKCYPTPPWFLMYPPPHRLTVKLKSDTFPKKTPCRPLPAGNLVNVGTLRLNQCVWALSEPLASEELWWMWPNNRNSLSSLYCREPEAPQWSRGCCEATGLAQVETPITHISVAVVEWKKEAGVEFGTLRPEM